MTQNSKNNKGNTNKKKSIVIPKKFLEKNKIKLEGVLNGRSRKIKPEPTDAVEQTLSANAAIKGVPYVSLSDNSSTANIIRLSNAKGNSPAREYYRNKKIYDEQLENYIALQKKKERFAKNSKIADLITSDPNYITKSAAPMDNTIIHFNKAFQINDGNKTIFVEPTSTEIPTPKQQLASLSPKPLPETLGEKILAYAPTAIAAAPVAYMVGAGGVAPLAISIWNNPISWAASTGLGYLGSEGVNSGIRLFTDYNSWGDVMADTRLGKYVIKELGPDVGKPLLEFTNPGGWWGGIKGWNIGRGGDKAINTYRLARELNKSVKNFDGTVGEIYFHAPDKIIKTDGTSTLIPRSDSKLNLQKTGDPFFDNANLPEGITSIPSPELIKINYLKRLYGNSILDRIKRSIGLSKQPKVQEGTLYSQVLAEGKGVVDLILHDAALYHMKTHPGATYEDGLAAFDRYLESIGATMDEVRLSSGMHVRFDMPLYLKFNGVYLRSKRNTRDNAMTWTHENTHNIKRHGDVDGPSEVTYEAEGFRLPKNKIELYYSDSEKAAYGTNILDHLGKTKRNLTGEELRRFHKHGYTESQNVRDVMNMIIDYDKAAKWINENSIMLIPGMAIGAGAVGAGATSL